MTRTDPGGMSGTQNYATSRGPCRCSHGEILHDLKPDKTRGKCSVTDLAGECGCRLYAQKEPTPALCRCSCHEEAAP